MLFNSQIFIFIFLPITLTGWFLLNHFKFYKLALWYLVGSSFWFYGYFNTSYLLILLSSITVNYLVSFLMERNEKLETPLFIFGLAANIGLLGYYKYYDFFIDNINHVFRTDFALKHILLPLGISFFTLQQISFLIDRHWGTAEHYSLSEYFAYVTFFPQLIAGPIVLHNEIIPQFNDPEKRRFNKVNFRDGLILFILGLIKKVLIADTFAYMVNFGFEKIYYVDTPSAWIIALSYTFELYFDFSGYCDMAVGLGRMFNFELPINFNSPYKSHSVPEYWNRWHATLTRFFTNYIYMPLTIKGVRKKKKKLYSVLAPMVVFFISGFWHGASWTFVIWGITQGLATVWCQRKFLKTGKKLKPLAWITTFTFTVITQAIFRSETMDNMVRILRGMFTLKYTGFMREVAESLKGDLLFKGLFSFISPRVSFEAYYMIAFFVMVILFAICTVILMGKNAHEILASQQEKGYTFTFCAMLSLAFTWCLISLSQVSTFLYFNF
ncbi:MAG: MBOAT family protein [Acetatifactor sp.]|nr:MBOAT family protein [Acetatifactor sp.]